jgi:molecular chaperone GrpE (heat shock protein)
MYHNPYKHDIRRARKVLEELKGLGWDQNEIARAEATLEELETRHARETAKARDETARTERARRIGDATDTLQRLIAKLETDKVGSSDAPKRIADANGPK